MMISKEAVEALVEALLALVAMVERLVSLMNALAGA